MATLHLKVSELSFQHVLANHEITKQKQSYIKIAYFNITHLI
jgi:hypothetical protein